ncbi:ATP-binding protein [Pseudofrankia sp. BMG5.36]|uniref:sensor histidine kinase n=1 Tax=Pseudofrankia sp. BMG5.36 TaxID=1834512 RepID=UPI0008D9DB93|nr:ATP-binding protein [Pseudofrankia sp. BMG5.36]OHV43362.1 two-component sensor histidine kinase [Pseudofrankia sp. BMG5.36]
MSLRARLLLALVGLLAVGLTLGAVGTHFALQSYLMRRLDQQVRDAHPVMEQTLLRGTGYGDNDSDNSGQGRWGSADGDDRDPRFGSAFLVGTYGALYDGGGHRLLESSPGPSGARTPTERPVIEAWLLAAAEVRPNLATAPLWTVPAEGHDDRFRMLAERFDNGDVLVVAVPYAEMDATLERVAKIEIIASSVVMAALVALAYLLIRVGLRPLTRIELTADEIAGGDLAKRVADTSRRTEVGRLGLAFNAMLTQIEAAFRAREASEQRLRRFVADASHELRTPLTSIRGYAEMFHRGAAERPEDLAMVMRRIEEESTRMTGLVDDLLLLARLDQGPATEREPVDVAAMVRDIVTDARVVAPNRLIETGTPPFLEITGDEGRLRQAIGNLVRNALVHTPPDTPIAVTVATTVTSAATTAVTDAAPNLAKAVKAAEIGADLNPESIATPGSSTSVNSSGKRAMGPGKHLASEAADVVISVIDHGAGIPEDAVAHIFERFYRADPGRSRDAGGTGLGLSIVAAVAAAHGGHIDYQPTLGGGATFRLIVPCR